ncbi:hypothetical protein [Caldicellulosiruptor hydrothermalis]|uniref:hypothetical protein n=1 Tax=Caldicellulosiruptor hydrothermalis TaxID=413888 RepID=UPI0003032EF7|nr:hypothetical protein [Caldicellulosiruptor hydrothermalis]
MEAKTSRIKYFPVSFFSVVMGLVGFTIALQKAEKVLTNILQAVSIFCKMEMNCN